MNRINFVAKDNFPISTNTYDELQKNTLLVSSLALIAGENYILKGCVEDGDENVSDGVIVVDGEILPFIGGKKKEKISIQQTIKAEHFAGIDYPEAYIFRVAQFSEKGDFEWNDFAKIPTIEELKLKVDSIRGDEPGTIKMWGGTISSIPKDYMICDGRPLKNEDYPELYKNLNAIHGMDGVDSFLLPDLRSRFVVGYDNQHANYNKIGETGGKEKVTLSESEMPRHRHKYSDDTNAQGKFPSVEDGFPQTFGGVNTNQSSGSSSGSGTVYYTSNEGGKDGLTVAHENRPPYFVLAYIIKVK